MMSCSVLMRMPFKKSLINKVSYSSLEMNLGQNYIQILWLEQKVFRFEFIKKFEYECFLFQSLFFRKKLKLKDKKGFEKQ